MPHNELFFHNSKSFYKIKKKGKMSKGHKQLVHRERRSKDQKFKGDTNLLLITKRVKIK